MNNHGGICILLRLLKVGYNGATWQTRIQDLLIKDQDQDSAVSRPRLKTQGLQDQYWEVHD